MQTLVITFQIPDGVQFQVNAAPLCQTLSEHGPNVVPVTVIESKTTGPTAEDLRRAFMEAVLVEGGKYKLEAIAALGKPTLKEVEPAEFAAVIARLNGVGK